MGISAQGESSGFRKEPRGSLVLDVMDHEGVYQQRLKEQAAGALPVPVTTSLEH